MRKPIRGIEDNRILTSGQIHLLMEFRRSHLKEAFRLTGGTALSAFYLEHRVSEDLDFFSSERVPFYICEDFLKMLPDVSEISWTRQFDRNIFNLGLADETRLKVEFTYFPLKNIEDTCLADGLPIDGFLDLVVNKLCAIADRIDPKDYVDLYWALKKSTLLLEHLFTLAEKKCEIKGITHILKNRLLQVPDGASGLSLMTKIEESEMQILFDRLIKGIVEKEIRRS